MGKNKKKKKKRKRNEKTAKYHSKAKLVRDNIRPNQYTWPFFLFIF
jgi:hypothetical protein